MRYYHMTLLDQNKKQVMIDNGYPFVLNTDNPNRALHVTFDVTVMGQDINASGAIVTIYGLPVSTVMQKNNLIKGYFQMYAGFQTGLPLANPAQQGLIIQGRVWNAYANWEGTHQTLNLVINPSASFDDAGNPVSLTLIGNVGDKVADVLMRTLKTTFPDRQININISDNLVLSDRWSATYKTLFALSTYIKQATMPMLKIKDYSGVTIVAQKGRIDVLDGTKSPSQKNLQLQDFMGQPTWIELNRISFKMPMRADFSVGDPVLLPADRIGGLTSMLIANAPNILLDQEKKLNFSGNFEIASMRHIGAYCHAPAENWVTVFEATGIS